MKCILTNFWGVNDEHDNGNVANDGILKIEFSIVHDRGEPQLPDTFYRIKKY